MFPDDVAEEIDEAEYLVRHVGKMGYLQLGFAHQGVMFIFEVATDWYDSFQDLLETVSDLGGIVVDDHEQRRVDETDGLCPGWAAAMDDSNGRRCAAALSVLRLQVGCPQAIAELLVQRGITEQADAHSVL